MKRSNLGAVYLFIAPPTMDELERRLRGRGTETEEKVCLLPPPSRRLLTPLCADCGAPGERKQGDGHARRAGLLRRRSCEQRPGFYVHAAQGCAAHALVARSSVNVQRTQTSSIAKWSASRRGRAWPDAVGVLGGCCSTAALVLCVEIRHRADSELCGSGACLSAAAVWHDNDEDCIYQREPRGRRHGRRGPCIVPPCRGCIFISLVSPGSQLLAPYAAVAANPRLVAYSACRPPSRLGSIPRLHPPGCHASSWLHPPRPISGASNRIDAAG